MICFETITRKLSFTCTKLEEVKEVLKMKCNEEFEPILYNGFPYKQIGHFYYIDLVKVSKLNEVISR